MYEKVIENTFASVMRYEIVLPPIQNDRDRSRVKTVVGQLSVNFGFREMKISNWLIEIPPSAVSFGSKLGYRVIYDEGHTITRFTR